MEPFIRQNYISGEPERLELTKWMEQYSWLSAGFTGRSGGRSEPPYTSLNLALHVGDDPEAVLLNRRLLAETLGFEFSAWTCGEQTHGAEVAVVNEQEVGRGRSDRETAFPHTDAMVTNVPGVLLTSFYADCVPLYFFDPVHQAVGLAHAGWKGTVQEIACNVLMAMEEEYGSQREDIRAAIGPSIGSCCYEVDEAVMKHVRPLLDSDNVKYAENPPVLSSQTAGRFMLNLKELNRIIMIKAGILPMNIECTSWCTSCHNDLFFSYRKENGVTGRMASWIGMKER